jgi:uncharacterized membrane protein YkvA (DUF1232 family)
MTRTTSQAFSGAGMLLDDGFRARLRLAWRLLRDDRVTPLKFFLPLVLVIYLASPVDAIPDVLLGIGQIDDLGIVAIALMLFVRIMPWLAPPEVVAEHAGSARHTSTAPRAGTAFEADFRVRGK